MKPASGPDRTLRPPPGAASFFAPTEEEEFEFYRRYSEGMASGQATIYRSRPAAADKQDQPKPPPQEENEL
jgi:hypothetical protein